MVALQLDSFADRTANPGEEAAYSNIAAALAGYLLELVTETSLPDYAIEEIFGLLCTENTSYRVFDLTETVVATPYSRLAKNEDRIEFPIYELATFPDGGLRTSVNDMARYLGAIMNEGTLELEDDGSITVLQPTSVEAMLRPRFDNGEEKIGVFWTFLTLPFEGGLRSLVGHTGGDPGASSYMFFDPESKTGFLIVTNGDDSNANPIELGVALLFHADELKQEGEITAPNETTTSSSFAPNLSPTTSTAVLVVSALGLLSMW